MRTILALVRVALGASAIGCGPSDVLFDASYAPAQPGCAPGASCAAPEGGILADAGSALHDANTPSLDAASVNDATRALDVMSPPQDASAPNVADAGADATSTPSDAASDASLLSDASSNNEPDAAGFAPVSDPSAKGPYASKTISNTGPSGAYTIFHPTELAPGGTLNPILTWGNGGFTTPADYPQLPHLASHGFVVIAANDSLVTGPQVRAGLDWIIQQNDVATSPFYRKLDVKRVAGVGYSNGGLATLDVANDPRYLTIVIISGANLNEDSRTQNMPKLHTPIAYLCTDDDASKGNCAADFAVVKQPAFFGVMKGTGHTDVTTILGLGVPAAITRVGAATTAWLRWHVMGDASFKTSFVGNDCSLCKDSAWTVQQKALQ